MKKVQEPAPMLRYRVLQTTDIERGRELTARVWAKHESHVIGDGGYESTISRVPLGRSFLCFVDCPSPMYVEAEANKTKATLYLPLKGSMTISARRKELFAVPGGPALIPAETKIAFSATGIHCVVFEVSAAKLRAQLSVFGVNTAGIPPLAWESSCPDARSLTDLLSFALREVDREDFDTSPGVHLLRLETLILSSIARAVASRLVTSPPRQAEVGQGILDRVKTWIAENLHRDFHSDELAAAAGVTPRGLQKIFLKFANTTPAHYVSDQRLEAARAALMDSNTTHTVSEIATSLNFHHFGRFSVAYHHKFGEAPSTTLKHGKCPGDYPKNEHK